MDEKIKVTAEKLEALLKEAGLELRLTQPQIYLAPKEDEAVS
jgi:hypothetical protein